MFPFIYIYIYIYMCIFVYIICIYIYIYSIRYIYVILFLGVWIFVTQCGGAPFASIRHCLRLSYMFTGNPMNVRPLAVHYICTFFCSCLAPDAASASCVCWFPLLWRVSVALRGSLGGSTDSPWAHLGAAVGRSCFRPACLPAWPCPL